MARRTKITAKINLAVLLDLRDQTRALAAHGIVEMQAAHGIVEQMLASIVVECTIPTNDTISTAEAARLAQIAEANPRGFIPALARAIQTVDLEHVMSKSGSKVHIAGTAS